MTQEVYENNQGLLRSLENGDIPNDKINCECGSFFRLVFRREEEDCIPLFFDFLAWKTGKNYSEELDWVQECCAEAKIKYEEFEEKIEENPLAMLLMAMMKECD